MVAPLATFIESGGRYVRRKARAIRVVPCFEVKDIEVPAWLKPEPLSDADMATIMSKMLAKHTTPMRKHLQALWRREGAWDADKVRGYLDTGQIPQSVADSVRRSYEAWGRYQLDVGFKGAMEAAKEWGKTATDLLDPPKKEMTAILKQRYERQAAEMTPAELKGIAAVSAAYRASGQTAGNLAQVLNGSVGLLTREQAAVASLVANLEADGVGAGSIRRQAKQYAGLLQQGRAMRIARTEVAFATNAGVKEQVKKAMGPGGAWKGKEVIREWSTASDEAVCVVCGPLDGTKATMDGEFSNGIANPPAHPHCRCIVLYHELTKGRDPDPAPPPPPSLPKPPRPKPKKPTPVPGPAAEPKPKPAGRTYRKPNEVSPAALEKAGKAIRMGDGFKGVRKASAALKKPMANLEKAKAKARAAFDEYYKTPYDAPAAVKERVEAERERTAAARKKAADAVKKQQDKLSAQVEKALTLKKADRAGFAGRSVKGPMNLATEAGRKEIFDKVRRSAMRDRSRPAWAEGMSNTEYGDRRAKEYMEALDKGAGFLDKVVGKGAAGVSVPGDGVMHAWAFNLDNGDRAFYQPRGRTVNLNRFESTRTMVHELGHHLENSAPGLQRAARDYLAKRAGNDKLKWLGQGYRRSEKTWADKFFNPYMGKYYPTDTELISMCLESLYADYAAFEAADPDSLDWILGILSEMEGKA